MTLIDSNKAKISKAPQPFKLPALVKISATNHHSTIVEDIYNNEGSGLDPQ